MAAPRWRRCLSHRPCTPPAASRDWWRRDIRRGSSARQRGGPSDHDNTSPWHRTWSTAALQSRTGKTDPVPASTAEERARSVPQRHHRRRVTAFVAVTRVKVADVRRGGEVLPERLLERSRPVAVHDEGVRCALRVEAIRESAPPRAAAPRPGAPARRGDGRCSAPALGGPRRRPRSVDFGSARTLEQVLPCP